MNSQSSDKEEQTGARSRPSGGDGEVPVNDAGLPQNPQGTEGPAHQDRREFIRRAALSIAGISIVGVLAPRAFAGNCAASPPDAACGTGTPKEADEGCNAGTPPPGGPATDVDNNCGSADIDNDCSQNQQGKATCGITDWSYDSDNDCGATIGGSVQTDNGCGDCGGPDNHDNDQDCTGAGTSTDTNCGDFNYSGVYDNDGHCGVGSPPDPDNDCGVYTTWPANVPPDNT